RGAAGEAAPAGDVTTGGGPRTANGAPAMGSPMGAPMGSPAGTGAPMGAAPYEQVALAWLAEEMRAAGLIGG
ncbi:hypothetical protein, partial [Microbispora triticiradicis]|uniref:hypothetical protein n=1 Tax=Microbispora triticiradicis TaxID=2200763 RepID=UPI001AD841B8